MCQSDNMINKLKHKNNIINTVINNNEVDPSRTLTLRNAFTRDFNVRWTAILRAVNTALIDEDVFGLSTPQQNKSQSSQLFVNEFGRLVVLENVSEADKRIAKARQDAATSRITTPGNRAFQFNTNSQKVGQFMSWLRRQVQVGMLSVVSMDQIGDSVNAAWSNLYIQNAYKRGVERARAQLRQAGLTDPLLTGSIEATMANPFHVDRLGLLYTRTYSELVGVTEAFDQHVSRILAQGLADGSGPREMARAINKVITGRGGDLSLTDSLGRFIPARRRTEMIARTEVIRAHAQAQLQEFSNWGVTGVGVQAEFRTAGDNRVCTRCEALEAQRFTIEQAWGVIPVHPSCRCIWIPLVV